MLFSSCPQSLEKRFKRRAVFLATNLETLGMVPFLVPGPCSTKYYLLALTPEDLIKSKTIVWNISIK